MKRIILNSILLGILFTFTGCKKEVSCGRGIAWDCYVKSFTETYPDYFKKNRVFFIKGMTLDAEKDGYNIKVIEDLKGNFTRKSNIFVWNGGGGDIAQYHNDTLIMHLMKCKDSDDSIDYTYMTLPCTYSVLKLSNGYVTGYIYPDKGYGKTNQGRVL